MSQYIRLVGSDIVKLGDECIITSRYTGSSNDKWATINWHFDSKAEKYDDYYFRRKILTTPKGNKTI